MFQTCHPSIGGAGVDLHGDRDDLGPVHALIRSTLGRRSSVKPYSAKGIPALGAAWMWVAHS